MQQSSYLVSLAVTATDVEGICIMTFVMLFDMIIFDQSKCTSILQ